MTDYPVMPLPCPVCASDRLTYGAGAEGVAPGPFFTGSTVSCACGASLCAKGLGHAAASIAWNALPRPNTPATPVGEGASEARERVLARLAEIAEQDGGTPSRKAMFNPADVAAALAHMAAQ